VGKEKGPALIKRVKLTQEFEKKYKNHQWDGEYFECLEQFFNEKNQI
jgi:hypothetical protein